MFDRSVEEYEKELDQELVFDKHDLDEEYVNQPNRYMKWAKLYGRSLIERKRAEEDLDRVKGTVDLEVRKDPLKFDLVPDDKGKVMEAAIKSAVNLDERVESARQKLYGIYELNKLFEHAQIAFIQRKELLKGEGDLWINGYYSSLVARDRAGRDERREGVEEDLRKHNRRRKL